MLEINTSKIKNTVTFSVDKDSLKKAKDSIVKFRELNRQLSQLSDARQVAFVDGFMKSLDPKVTEEFMKNLSNLTPYFTKLGEAVTNGAIVIHTQRLKSDPGGNLLS
ncbi:hypothetical protein Q8V72_005026 [Escherichia coli]|nr:hypothetical protein [Escherichia coli]